MHKNIIRPVDIVRIAFPTGTLNDPESKPDPTWDSPPWWPPDLFGICAHLLDQSGAYHYLSPGSVPICEERLDIKITKKEKIDIEDDAAIWRVKMQHCPDWVKSEWKIILDAKRALHARRSADARPDNVGKRRLPRWWKSAILLAAYADETCQNIGHSGVTAAEGSQWISNSLQGFFKNQKSKKLYEGDENSPDRWATSEGLQSITIDASDDLFCVQPKSRTPAVGCTLRSISLHLSLLPSAGVIQAAWQYTDSPSVGTANQMPFNCLVVPFPYKIDDEDFTLEGDPSKRWMWFALTQSWLPQTEAQNEKFLKFIDSLILQADLADGEGGTPVNAIVFPEYALTWELHERIVKHIIQKSEEERKGETPRGRQIYGNIQFLITGSSNNCHGETGNFILTTQILEALLKKDRIKDVLSTSRAKHHRWRIDEAQLDAYNLKEHFAKTGASATGQRQDYWEKIRIPRRRFHVHTFKDHSVLTALICEDLARAEPVHKFVRAVGPDLIFVLLMDGCQIEQRWSARYAMGLAEDPGSTVVTLTSRGLVRRSNDRLSDQDGHVASWSIGLARSPGQRAEEIRSEPGVNEAALLKFQAVESQELTIDGRRKASGFIWQLQTDQIKSVKLDRINDRDLLQEFVKDFQ